MPKSNQDLRELVDSLHPRSPKEVMGEAASSSLLGSTITAALSTVTLVLGLTLIVFFLGGGPEKKSEAAATAPPTVPQQTPTAKPATANAVPQPATDQSAASDPAATDGAINAMGIGETKNPDSEPETLENRLDQLLDGLE